MKLRREKDPHAIKSRFAVLVSAFIALVVIANALYLFMEWHRQRSIMASEATVLANSLEALIHPEHVSDLEGSSADLNNRHYRLVKSALVRLAAADSDIGYAYLIDTRGQRIIFLADSLDESDPASAKPGDVYPAAADEYMSLFTEGRGAFIPRVTDARGTWVRALAPVVCISTGAPIALFGIDYDSRLWYGRLLARMRPDFIVSLNVVLLSVALVGVYAAHARLRIKSGQTAASEALLHGVFDQAPIGIAISSKMHVLSREHAGESRTNRAFARIFGRSADELADLTWDDVCEQDEAAKARLDRFLAGEAPGFAAERDFTLPDGRHVLINLMLSRLAGAPFEGGYLTLLEDITQRRAAEEALRESERSRALILSHLPGMAYRCRFDPDWTMEFVSEGCVALTGYQPDELIGNRVISFGSVIAPTYRNPVWAEWEKIVLRDGSFRFEYEIMKKSGELRWVYEIGKAVRAASGEIVALEGIIIDVTDRKVRDREIAYLSEHDHLTGLYDRRYMLEAAARMDAQGIFPVSVAVCDINGVRVVNLAFGNEEGDQLIADVGAIISSCGREGDLVGRTGGDEFTLILPGADIEEAGRIAKKIELAVERYNRADNRHPYEVSLSISCDAKESKDAPIEQVIKAAGEYLMQAKLLNQKSSHSALLSSIMATLYARNQETEEHGKRLARYARMIGEALDMPPKALDEMQLLSMLHDIGKVGIDDRVLNKPASLTDEEREAMMKHSEIGHRIALSSPELEHIADSILHHHERWDGTGYPAGLAGEAIPLSARILAVCDAYDAMTEDRVYRRAMERKDALREIARCAGTQFDPAIAHLFIRLMEARREADA